MNTPRFAIAAVLLSGALATGASQAHGSADVQWSVQVVTPTLRLPGHIVLPLPPVLLPRAVVVEPRRDVGYREPTRWDVDGDGIPNRYDRVYNPRWDRDGDGIPNRYDRTPYGGYNAHEHRGWRDERRDDRRDGRRGDRHGDHDSDWRRGHDH
jgi:hypothetical protein